MRKLSLLLMAVALFPVCSRAQLKIPAPSPPETVKQDFGLGTIELSYSRPGVKGRKIFGDLVPYGKIWRTGANAATTIAFSDTVIIGGQAVPPGKYGLLTIPGPDEWTLIISRQTDVSFPADYKEDQDLVRVKAKPMRLPQKIESFTMQLADISDTHCDLHLSWDHTRVTLPIQTDIDSRIMANIHGIMNGEDPKKPYYGAAFYYLEHGKDLHQALEWFNKAVEQSPKAYFMFYQKARCEAKLGQKEAAVATAKQSMELAKEAKNEDYVKLNEKLIAGLK